MTRHITRRQALADAFSFTATGLLLSACASAPRQVASTGSTLEATWVDPRHIGVLQQGRGEHLISRTDLAPQATEAREIATLAHITDAHVLDASSPARATFLDRLGAPFESTFRPHETLTAQVLAGAVNAVNHLQPDAVIQGGDLIDNAQSNELTHALQALKGGTVHPGSGPHGYYGVQLASDPDPFYYRPDLDAPRHPGLLKRAIHPFTSRGIKAPVHPVLGDHDILVQGVLRPTSETRKLALGDQALWEIPPHLSFSPTEETVNTGTPDGPPLPGLVSRFIAEALKAPKVKVPADQSRRELSPHEAIEKLGSDTNYLDYHVDVSPELRLIVLDLARREGGSGGLVRPGQPAWLEQQLQSAKGERVIVVSHQPIASSEGGDQMLALLDRHKNVIAALCGHTHNNQIVPRPSPTGGYWLINTASLIDYPQQARALRVIETKGGGTAIETWMLDHIFPGDLGTISRQLAYLDAQGGRPKGFAGSRLDRNVTLYLR
jgi:3',5'-cyclic AMP phosphodiesterase CpdA